MKARTDMRAAGLLFQRSWLVSLLLPLFLVALVGCGPFQCEAYVPPSVIPQLFVAGGRVYTYSEGTQLVGLQADSGKRLWQTVGGLEAADAQQFYLDYYSQDSSSTVLEAVRASDGKHLWQTQINNFASVTATAEGVVYLFDPSDGSLKGLSSSDGAEQWEVFPTFPPGTDEEERAMDTSVQVSASVVYARTFPGWISAYQAQSGTLLWKAFPPDGSLQPWQAPWQISAGVIYLSTGFHLYALRASDGQVLWKQDSSQGFAVDSASGIVWNLQADCSGCRIVGGLQADSSGGAQLIALQAQTGHILWQRPEPQLQVEAQRTGLLLIGGILYSGIWDTISLPTGMYNTYFRGTVSAIRASDGQFLWQYPEKDAGEMLEVTGTQTTAFLLATSYPATDPTFHVTAVRVSDGEALWHHTTPAAGMVLDGDVLYTSYGGDGVTSGCTATGVAHITKYQAADGKVLWDTQL